MFPFAAGTPVAPGIGGELVTSKPGSWFPRVRGCSACVDGGAKTARKAGVSDERLATVAAWREAPYFSEEERAALALAEAATRLADRPEAVADEVWDAAATYFDE